MPRRNRGKPLRHHPNGKARPSDWHRGPAAFAAKQKKLDAIEPAFAAAEEDVVAVVQRTAEHRREMRDYEELLAQLDRCAPFVFAPLPPRNYF